MTGRLLVFEGAEGSGKTTQVARLSAALTAHAIDHLVVREPGGTAIGERIRALLLDPASEIAPRTEALLFLASRAELVDRVIRPAIDRGALVIADRFFLSTYAYQVAGRGLQEDDIRSANVFATGALVPDLTILLVQPAGDGLARADRRGARDRIERAGAEFHERVAGAFASFADPAWQRAHPESGATVAVDASGPVDEVFARVVIAVTAHWPEFTLA